MNQYEETTLHRLLEKIKKHPILATGSLLFTALTMLASLPSMSDELRKYLPATPTPSPQISNFVVCPTPCDGTNATDTFPEGTTEIHARWNHHNIPVGVPFVRSWKWNDEEWVRYICSWDREETGVFFPQPLSERHGLRSGTWEFSVSVNDEVLLTKQFYIEGTHNYWVPAGVEYSCESKE